MVTFKTDKSVSVFMFLRVRTTRVFFINNEITLREKLKNIFLRPLLSLNVNFFHEILI